MQADVTPRAARRAPACAGLALLLLSLACGAPDVTVLDPALLELVPADARIQKLAGGFGLTEGPVWVGDPAGGALVFSDIPGNAIYRWRPDGTVETLLAPVTAPDAKAGGEGGANGLVLDRQARLVLCEHGNRRISRLEADGSRTSLAERYQGRRLNSPNDAVFRSDGSLYFTDPSYGLPGRDSDPNRELAWNGIYRLRPGGELELLATEPPHPNGIALAPDETRLYVSNSDPLRKEWWVYALAPDGRLGPGRVLLAADDAAAPGVPDGLTVDRRGNLYATGPGGVWVISPEGRHLGTLRAPDPTTNVAWGDDGRTLYVTASTGLYRVRLLEGGEAR